MKTIQERIQNTIDRLKILRSVNAPVQVIKNELKILEKLKKQQRLQNN